MYLLFKSMLIKIKKSVGRFTSILLIIAVGMGFFGGLRAASPSMITTINNYYKQNNLMDAKIISTMGLTNNDIEAIQQLDDKIKVIPSYSVDALENGISIRIHALENDVNKVTLVKGRLPQDSSECVADSTNYKLGDNITVEGSNLDDYIINKKYTVVGLINSVLYVAHNKGISNVGNGKLSSFIFILKTNFKLSYYTEAYITINNSVVNANSKKYQVIYNSLYEKLLVLKPIREAIRYEEILKDATSKINKIQSELNTKLNKAKDELSSTKSILDNNQNKINDAKKTINNNLSNLDNTLSSQNLSYYTLDTAINSLTNTITSLQDELNNINTSTEEYYAKDEYLKTLKNNLTDLETIKNSYKTLYSKLSELNNSQIELDKGYALYNDGLSKLKNSETEANNKITDAKNELSSIEQPIWYLQDRADNYGYANFFDDASVVESISNVFPIFFIVIVALIILNTITRMIEEERTEIGTLKSLGFSNFYIIFMYILYTSIASLIGTTIGLIGGYTIVPSVIYNIYGVTYILPKLQIDIGLISFIIMILTGVVLIISVTIYGCLKELNDVPSSLLRPKAPKEGKKVFIERIKILWNKLSFIWKITIRNLFRYKKRIIMTVVGVAGSTALLIAGFGLKDSINGLGTIQYSKIIKYDALIVLDDNYSSIPKDVKSVINDYSVVNYLMVNQESYKFTDNESKINDVYLIATKQYDISNYINLNKLLIPNYGVIINTKMAKLLNVKINDNISIRSNKNQLYILNVKGIVENYTLNYIYMSDKYYKLIFDKDLTYNSILTNIDNLNHNDFANSLVSLNHVNTINYNSDNIKTFDTMIKGINNIVYLIIISACLLSVVILYNLTIININERKREISTLKVLGFNDKEISSYVNREIIILTLIGIVIGIFLGILLLRFVINTSEPANMVFLRKINLISYIYSILLVICFMFIVKWLTKFRLSNIDMIESLKSVE